MSKTTTINPINSGDKSTESKKKAAAFAASTVAAAGAGIAGAHIVSELIDSEDMRIDDNAITADSTEELGQHADEISNAPASNSTTAHPSTSTGAQAHTSESSTSEPQPITNGDIADSGEASEQIVEPTSLGETDVNPSNGNAEQLDLTPDGVVDPDEIAEAIIAGNEIDPVDIDMEDIVNFDEIGTVYTVDGESYTAATVHDASGNNLVMVDVDGDNVFDVITDYDGNLIAEVPGNLSVGDAQEDIADDEVYLSYDNEMDNVDEYGDDTLADDLMA